MPHNVADTVLAAFARMRTGARWQSPLGLTVCELLDDSAEANAPQRGGTGTAHLTWREMDPPDPHRLRVRSQERATVVLEAGTLVDGGMGTRALRSCAVVPAGIDATVVVETLGARWWDEGPLHHGGRVDPVATALLFQAALAAQPLASSATTAVHSLPRADLVTGAVAAPRPAGGWLLEDDEGIVGGWIVNHAPVVQPRPHLAWHHDLCAPEAASLRLFLALQEDIDYGALEAHVIDHGRAGRDMVLLPRGVCLADRARAGITATR